MTANIQFKEVGTSNFLNVDTSKIARARFVDNGTSALNKLEMEFSSDIQSGTANPFYNRETKLVIDSAEIFGGRIERQVSDKAEYPLYLAEAWSYGAELLDNYVNKVYTNTTPEAIVEDVITNFTNLTYSSSTTSGVSIDKIVFRDKTGAEVIQLMASLLDYYFYTDANKNAYFEPLGAVSSGITLDLSQTTIQNGTILYKPKWEYNTSEVVTRVIVEGGLQNFDTSETFTATASQTDFVLAYEPAGQVRVTVNGTEKNPTVSGSTSGDYELDAENKTISFATGLTGGETVIVYYSYSVPIKITANTEQLDDDGQTISKTKLVKKKTIRTQAEARKFADKYLAKYGQPQKSATIPIIGWVAGLEAGKTIQVIDAEEGINESLLIEEVVYTYENNITQVTVGATPDLIFNWQAEVSEKLRELLQQNTNADILQEYRQFKHNLQVGFNVNHTVSKASPTDSFILGHATLGRLRTDLNFEADCSDNGNHGTWKSNYVETATALYTFRDGSGTTLTDVTSNGNDGTITGATWTTDHLGNENSALSFNGSSDYVSFSSDPLSGDSTNYSVGVIIKQEDTNSSGNQTIITRVNKVNDTSVIQMALVDGYPSFDDFNPSGGQTVSSTYIADGQFHRIDFVRDGTTRQIWIDGVLDTEDTSAETYTGTAPDEMIIGMDERDTIGPYRYLNATISSVILNDIVLSADEISSLYEATKVMKLDGINYGEQYIAPAYNDTVLKLDLTTNPTANVVDDVSLEENDGEYKINATALYDFTDGSGTTLTDNSLNSNDGTISNATWTTDHLGNANSALDFDGSTGEVNTGVQLNSNTSGTIGVWVKNDDFTKDSWVINAYDSTSEQMGISFRNSSDTIRFAMNGVEINQTGYLENTWYFLVMTWDGTGTYNAYIDGSFKFSRSYTPTANDQTLYLGAFNNSGTPTPNLDGQISQVILISTELSADEVLNLYNYTSVHKLTSPLVTKTDSDRNSITGYESWAPIQTTGTEDDGTYLELDSNIDAPMNNHCFYFEIKNDTEAFQRIAAHSLNASTGRIDMNTSGSENYIRIESTTNNYWSQEFTLTTPLDDGKVHKILIEFNSDATRIYVDGTLEATGSANDDTLGYFRYRYFLSYEAGSFTYGSGFNGVFAKPTIFNRILTSTERDALFAGTDSALIAPVQRLSAGKFNGSDNYVASTSADIDPSSGLSLCIFQQADSASGNSSAHLFGISNSANGGSGNNYFEWEDDSTLRFKLYGTDGSTTLDATPTKTPDEKAFYCAVYDGTNMYIYEDGGLLNSTAKTWTTDANYTTVTVGANSGATAGHFAGKLDEALIFNTALTTDDMQDIIDNKFYSNHSKYANCVLWYSFDNPRTGSRVSNRVLIEETNK